MANGYSTMGVPSGMGMTGGAMPAPLATFLSNLPLSNAPTIAVNESTPNLDRIQNFPVVSRNGVFHIHQDPATGQRYSMTDEFHARIPEILSRRILINSTVVGNIINISNLSSFDNTYSTGKFLPIDLQIKDFLGRIAENELEKRIFENDIYSKNTYSETLPLYKNLIQRTYTTLFNEIPKSILNGTVNSESVNNTSEVANNLKSMSPDVNYGNNVSTKVQQQYSGLPVNTVYRPVVMIDQQMIQSSVTSRQNFPVNTYYKVR